MGLYLNKKTMPTERKEFYIGRGANTRRKNIQELKDDGWTPSEPLNNNWSYAYFTRKVVSTMS